MTDRREVQRQEWETSIEARDRWRGTTLTVLGVALTFALYYLGETRNDFFFGGATMVYSARWARLAFGDWRKHWKVVRG